MRKIFFPILMAFGLVSCTNIDCPLDNVVVMTSGIYQSETGQSLPLDCELTITSADQNYILLNKVQGVSSFEIPLRHSVDIDTLLFNMNNSFGKQAIDTLFLSYTDSPHFESVDCPAALFHTLQSVNWTSHPLAELPLTIDKVEIVRSLVDYNDVENLKIYFRTTTK